jgi:TolB-like protein
VQNRQLRLRFLGSLSVECGGKPVVIASRKARALLGYLAQRENIPVARTTLMGLLWGDRSEDQARASLRQTLSELRQALGPEGTACIVTNLDCVTWAGGGAWTDTRALGLTSKTGELSALLEAADLYRGEFLEGLDIHEPAFEQWLAIERENLRLQAAAVLARLMAQAEAVNNVEQAIAFGQRLLGLDPLQEHVHRDVMRLFAAQGRHDAALAQFEKCRQLLESRLGVQPQPETLALQQTLRAERRERSQPASGTSSSTPSAPQIDPVGKVTIGVLPFTNLTSDPEQDYFADGITEDLIGALSRIGEFFVISRSTSFVYKGRNVRAQDAAAELGVRHVLEGGVRVVGGRFRVTVQLIDGQSAATVWSERYEGGIDDIFAVQDEITRNIALAMQVKLTSGESARLWEGQTRNLRAWEKMVEARALFYRWTAGDNSLARQRLKEALALDPACTGAMALLGKTHWWDARFNVALDKEACLGLAEGLASRILDINPEMSAAYVLRSGIAFLRLRHDDAEALCEQAIKLVPSDAFARAYIGMISYYAGKDRAALEALHTALRFSPLTPSWFVYYICWAAMWLGDFSTARKSGTAYITAEPDEPYGYVMLCTLAAFEGDDSAAAAWVVRLRDRVPSFGLADVERSQPFKDMVRYRRLVDGLRRAGLT